MLFNSGIFLFAFLPVALAGYFLVLKLAGKLPSQLWLFAASLFFYGWWNPAYLVLILASMGFNYLIGGRLQTRREKPLLVLGLAANLLVLGYYKYTAFFISNVNVLGGTSFDIPHIILPLGISFFTFQKIAFLVDCYKREVPREQNWINFGLFISFFPQLIAGPIVHHKEMMPQFDKPKSFSAESLAVGLCLLTIGLFKKTIIADALDVYVTPLFAAAALRPLHFVEAWAAMLTYTFQIYFDFSGYSDMALGLGKMFGVRLPVNFFSPYKSENIIAFWRRWHMTLSRFLRDYLYIPLGGNRKGPLRRYFNLFATMLLGGFWHGAQWSFLIWGGLHGAYLIINHLWHHYRPALIYPAMMPWMGRVITFLAVAAAWVFFRAESARSALSVLASLTHVHDLDGLSPLQVLVGPKNPLRAMFGAAPANRLGLILLLCFIVCWAFPNSIEIMRRGKPAISGIRGFFPLPRNRTGDALAWRPSLGWGIVVGMALSLCLVKVLYEPSQIFLYFRF
jgi:D-alanyl-lipoteichoic acid acyltransferase DltB (MBOAT superfamily)